MTPFKFSFFLFLSLVITTSCTKEEEPDVPCVGSFSCTINGEPFDTSGRYDCSSKTFSYSFEQKSLTIGGTNCSLYENGFRNVSLRIDSVDKSGISPLSGASCQFLNSSGVPFPHNQGLIGQISIINFVTTDYSKDYTGGYIEGTFWFTAYNEDTKDTAYVTNGQFCGRI